MSELSKAIERYANGIADASEVIKVLPAPKEQTPQPSTSPTSLRDLADSEKAAIAEGTWEEVAFAHLTGVLSDDQYAELYEAYTP